MNALHIVVGTVVASALLAAIALAIPKPSNPISAEPSKFDAAWNDTAVPLALAPPRIIPLDAPKVVKTEVITPEVITQADISTPVTRKPKPKEHASEDVCRGKGKRYTHNGKSWRCRK